MSEHGLNSLHKKQTQRGNPSIRQRFLLLRGMKLLLLALYQEEALPNTKVLGYCLFVLFAKSSRHGLTLRRLKLCPRRVLVIGFVVCKPGSRRSRHGLVQNQLLGKGIASSSRSEGGNFAEWKVWRGGFVVSVILKWIASSEALLRTPDAQWRHHFFVLRRKLCPMQGLGYWVCFVLQT